MNPMPAPLIPTRFLFRFSAPCRRREPLWTDKGAQLDESYRLVGLVELEEQTAWADVRAAWSETGLVVAAHVLGKTRPPWRSRSLPEDSDGLHVWVDTRDVHNVHRAGRFCHRFLFLPDGTALWLPINRAREQPRPIPPGTLQIRTHHAPRDVAPLAEREEYAQRKDGYVLEAFMPAEALTGFDPAEHPRLGFTYAVIDREMGEQTFGVGSPMPYQEDPGLWATLEMVR